MSNNEKFNAMLNSCAHSRQIYNTLMAFGKPCLQQPDNVSEKRQVIIGELLSFFGKTKGN